MIRNEWYYWLAISVNHDFEARIIINSNDNQLSNDGDHDGNNDDH